MPNEEIIALLAAAIGKKGGVDLSSLLNDPFLSFLSGTYQGEPQESEGEIYAREAPTLLAIQEMEPEGSWRKVAAGKIASGIPAYRVKEDLLVEYNDNPEIFGAISSKEALAFIDDIGAENQKAQNAITKQLQQKDYFQQKGLPGARDQYSPEDVVRLMPQAFEKIGKQIANPPAEIQALLKRVQQSSATPVMREDKPRTKESERTAIESRQRATLQRDPIAELAITNSIASRYGVSQEQVLKPDKKDPNQVRANEAYMKELDDSAKLVATLGTSDGAKLPLGGVARTLVRSLPFVNDAIQLSKILSYRPETESDRMKKEQEAAAKAATPSAPKQVVNKSATQFKKMLAAQAAAEVGRMRGGEEYNQTYAGALADRLSQRMAESGRSPLMDAIVKQALVSRAFRK